MRLSNGRLAQMNYWNYTRNRAHLIFKVALYSHVGRIFFFLHSKRHRLFNKAGAESMQHPMNNTSETWCLHHINHSTISPMSTDGKTSAKKVVYAPACQSCKACCGSSMGGQTLAGYFFLPHPPLQTNLPHIFTLLTRKADVLVCRRVRAVKCKLLLSDFLFQNVF